jgi:23S rRNA pseudouridine1911/1915/1917 synthase
MAKSEALNHHFTVETPGSRLDVHLGVCLPEMSRATIQKLILAGQVTVSGRAGRAGYRLRDGDVIEVTVPPPKPSYLTAEAIPLDIIYEDADVLVLNKPAGLTVHPAPGHPDGTLVNALLGHLPAVTEAGDPARPGIVHRLDKDTSGVMVAVKNAPAHTNLMQQFKDHRINKIYLVLVRGRLKPERGVVQGAIGRDPGQRQRMAVVAHGRDAVTHYTVLEYLAGYSLLEVKLETGRTHQIRVHLKAIGFPVVGDAKYGIPADFCPRQFVHALQLGFTLPSSGEYREFQAPLAPDLEQALDELRTRAG